MKQLGLVSRPPPARPNVALDHDPCPGSPRPFVGFAITLEHDRRCAVCGNVCPEGSTVISAGKWIAHVGCGHRQARRDHHGAIGAR